MFDSQLSAAAENSASHMLQLRLHGHKVTGIRTEIHPELSVTGTQRSLPFGGGYRKDQQLFFFLVFVKEEQNGNKRLRAAGRILCLAEEADKKKNKKH